MVVVITDGDEVITVDVEVEPIDVELVAEDVGGGATSREGFPFDALGFDFLFGIVENLKVS